MRGAVRLSLLAVMAAVAVAGCTSSGGSVTPDDPVVARKAGSESKVLVQMGDSYMSGEAGRIASNQYVKKAASEDESDETIGGVTVGGFDVYDASQQDGPQTPWCHRTTSAPGFIGGGWTTINLACSGAETVSDQAPHRDGTTQTWKPGIDYGKSLSGDFGQARMLEAIAGERDVAAVALSIGGNNFNFSGLVAFCAKKYLLSQDCSKKDWARNLISDAKATEVQAEIEAALFNVQRAMFTADVANRDKRWKLVYQLPPLPMSRHADNQFVEALGNRTAGGCPFRDDDLDWFAGDAARTIRTTMVKAVQNFYSSGKKKGNWTLTILDDGNAFAGRRLCDRNTDRTTTSASPGVVSPPDWNKAGKDSEWISEVILWDQLFDVDDKLHKVTEPMHPTYWGQRALAGCMRLAIDDSRTDQVLYCERGDGSVRADGTPEMKIVKADTPYRQQPGVDVVGLTEIFGEGRSGLQHLQFRPAGGTAVTSWATTGTTISKDVGDADEVGKPRSLIAEVQLQSNTGAPTTMKLVTTGRLTASHGGGNPRVGKYGQRRYIDGSTKITASGIDCSGRSEFMMVGSQLRYLRVEPNTGCEVQAW